MYASAELPKYNIIFTLWLGRGLQILYFIHFTPRPSQKNIILYSPYASAEVWEYNIIFSLRLGRAQKNILFDSMDGWI